MPLFPIFSLILYFNSRSSYTMEDAGKASPGDDEGTVKIEDLYAGMAEKNKKAQKRKDESSSPTIEDLMP
jgi:hypothetical protein